MTVYADGKENCCGCTACMLACPTGAISMAPDPHGFKYPVVEETLCIHCSLCKQVCAFTPGKKETPVLENQKVFAVHHKAESQRRTSSSGGMFAALADHILQTGGIVYGAGLDAGLDVCHLRIAEPGQRAVLSGSKYVQSEMGDCFGRVRRDLEADRTVLFSGTGCQTAGLRNVLEKLGVSTGRLYTCDLVCHGVPSPLLYTKYREYLRHKYGKSLISFNFREQGIWGWRILQESFVLEDGKKRFSTDYATLFGKDLGMRPSCHRCPYSNLERPSDITLGDFWGIEKSFPDFGDALGTSLVLVNSLKGEQLFNRVKEQLDFRVSSRTDCLQPNLERPTPPAGQENEFWVDMENQDFGIIRKKYISGGPYKKMKRLARSAVGWLMYTFYNKK